MLRDLRESLSLRLISGDTDRELPMLEPFFDPEEMEWGCTPDKKNAAIAAASAKGQHVLMVGDGLNDAGAMETADVAVAVSEDTATLVPACDIIMHADSLVKLPRLLQYARQLKQVILASFIFSIVYNVIGLWLAVEGMLTPLAAAILMPVSSITVIALSVAGARYFGRRRIWE
jgi:Cu+-exporting ATPase